MRHRSVFVSLLLILCAQSVAAQEVRVLLAGDSWADFMWANRSLRDTFAANGRPDLVEDGTTTTESGTTAADWTSPARLQALTDALDAQPTIDVVQLTIGGNDYLAGESGGGWFVDMPPSERAALDARVLADVATVVDHLLAYDPKIQVVLSLYDYSNFEGAFFPGCGSRFLDLGEPTPLQLNTLLIEAQELLETLRASRPRLHTVRHLGLMQFLFGFPDDGIPPGQLLPPGDTSRPSPREAMFLQIDCIHLSPTGYAAVTQNLWDGVYEDLFQPLFADGFESGDTGAWVAIE